MLDWTSSTIVCPNDKQTTYVEKVFKLMVNHALADHNTRIANENHSNSCDSPNSSLDSYQALCCLHQKERNLFCLHEKAFICEDCVPVFHVGSFHTIHPADEAIERQVKDMERVGKEMRQTYRLYLKEGQQIQKSYAKNVEIFDKYVTDTKVAMQRRFEFQMKAAKESQRLLKQQIDDVADMCKRLRKHEEVNETLQKFTELLAAKADAVNHATRYDEFNFNYHSTFRNLIYEIKSTMKPDAPQSSSSNGSNVPDVLKVAPTDIMMHPELVARLRSKRYITSDRVYNAMLRVPREDFVDDPSLAYIEKNLPFIHDHTLAAPAIVAEALENLGDNLKKGAKVLQVGVRGGYHAACFAYMVGKTGKVIVADQCRQALEKAEKCLRKSHKELLDHGRIVFRHASHETGLSDLGLFDAIYVGAALPMVPHPLVNIMAPQGRLMIYTGS
eukprot:CAMPEP_0114978766 /NCGR_PEP_ID=MMETSP0216-20121206/3996_1 /TAXON_ID=223996 /ORGANISM="Protocruzia adherens, Strain Boccale" /LENGTH=443 /DNA_ID=CAMNT_0002340013 /DNA_START=225 /DNA_END=1552 /DNA_ORIENTATION=-